MSAPAVKPVLPTSGAQAPRVGSGAPTTAPNNPPTSAAGGPKLPSNPTSSPVKPSGPGNANHAVSAMPLSLVQDHKVQGNTLPQSPTQLPRTPDKTKELTITSSVAPKPTSNGVEGSPNKSPMTLTLSTDSKKVEEILPAAPVLNHLAETTVSSATVTASMTATSSSTGSGGGSSSSSSSSISITSSSSSTNTAAVTAATAAASAPAVPTSTSTPAAVTSSVNMPLTAPLNTSSPSLPLPQQSPHKQDIPAATTVAVTSGGVTASATVKSSPPNNTSSSLCNKSDTAVLPETKAAISNTTVNEAPTTSNNTQSALPSGPVSGITSTTTSEPPIKPVQPEVTKTRIEVTKPEFKVATTPRISKRKRETKPVTDVKTSLEQNDDRKSKRVRIRTQPYQSPLPELTYMTKIKSLMKTGDDKLTVFYKNEFLAVRNAEGSFFVCQAMQNIYKSSTRIRIRWLSQDKKDNKVTDVYIPDFYDVIEFDCILTNLELKKLDKNKYQLPQDERDRTQSILKRALDVEKGVAEKPPITEEHPDGLDLSLYRDEAQLMKKRSSKKSPKKAEKLEKDDKAEGEAETSEESQEEQPGESEEDAKKKKQKSKSSKKEKSKVTSKDKTKARDKDTPKKERTSERERGRESTKRKAEPSSGVKNAVSKPSPEKKQKTTAPKPSRKTEKPDVPSETTIPTRSSKSRSAKAVVPQPSKSSPVTRTKERERRVVSTSQSRKKPGKKA